MMLWCSGLGLKTSRCQPRAYLSSGSALTQACHLSLGGHLGGLLRLHGGQHIREHRSLRLYLLHVTGYTGVSVNN